MQQTLRMTAVGFPHRASKIQAQALLTSWLNEEVTDVTDKYSADQITSLDGISAKNVEQYHFNDLYLVQGIGNSPFSGTYARKKNQLEEFH